MIIDVTESNFQKEVLESRVPVLVEFYAPWCPRCAMAADTVSEFEEENRGRIKVCRINTDLVSGLADRFGVQEVPLFVGFCSGRAVGAMTGAAEKEKFFRILQIFKKN